MLSFNLVVNANASTGVARYDELEGRQHIVAPMVMITEGVHAGSRGPLKYAPDDMQESVPLWNHKPVVVYHPTENGKHVSACSPVQINARKVGIILNTRFDEATVGENKVHRLPAECWMDVARLKAIDERILEALESNTPMEISTGLYNKPVAEVGVFNGKPYATRATKYAPDHLALLPDTLGACGLKDGAGLLVNSAPTDAAMQQHGLTPFVRAAMQSMWDQYTLNAKSYGNIQDDLSRILRERFDSGDSCCVWITEVYSDFVIYENAGLVWKLPYKLEGDVVMVPADAQPEQVVRVTEYRTLEGSFVGNTTKENEPMKRTDLVSTLITNGKAVEGDRALLEGMTDDQFSRLANSFGLAATEVTTGTPPAVIANAAPVVAPAAPQTIASVLQDPAMPAELRQLLANGLQSLAREQTQLIAAITTNAPGVYTEAELKVKEVPELQRMVQLTRANAAAPVTDPVANQLQSYFGNPHGGVFVGNAGAPDLTVNDGDVPVLKRPVME